jgi:RHS repeat-associated protein
VAEANRSGDAPNRYSDWSWSTSTTQTQVSPPTLDRLSRYVWRVTSINAGGATASAWQVFETAPDPPGPVQLAGPAHGTVTGRHARVRWTAVSGALSYEIQFAPIADGAGPGAANWGGSAVRTVQHVAPSWGAGAGPGSVLRASATGLAHDQRYAWRVRGVNPAEAGPWPEARALRTETAPGGRRYYVSDHLRSTRAVVDPVKAADPWSGPAADSVAALDSIAAQSVVEARDYYPYGLRMPGRQVLQDAQGAPQDYTGHELDEATGFHYAGARYYSSALARWGSVDPLADKFPSLSPLSYVDGNPIHAIDPDGKDYILVLNHKNKTATVRATFFVAKGDEVSRDAANKGAQFWDRQSGNFRYQTSDDNESAYTVNFDINVQETSTLKPGFSRREGSTFIQEKRRQSANDSSVGYMSDGSNAFTVVNDAALPSTNSGTKTRGATFDGAVIQVGNSATQTSTPEHEIGHSLGLSHSRSGIMASPANSPRRQSKVTKANVGTTVGSNENLARKQIWEIGDRPDDFQPGQIIDN